MPRPDRGGGVVKQDIIGIIMGIVFGFVLGALVIGTALNQEAVSHNCAHYDTQTGKFKWGAP